MFDLITGKTRHIPSKPGVPLLVSVSTQAVLITAIVLPVLLFTGALPEVPTMMAFVAAAPPPPPPPPPAAPPAAKAVLRQTPPTSSPDAAPVEPPASVQPERAIESGELGVPGGVEGGIPGGVVGGVVGGLPGDIPPPPPPPQAPPPPKAPIRVGGQIKAPEIVRRVDPVYPDIAISARMRGVVILEASVDRNGHVVDVTVLRSVNRWLDQAAIEAVREWQYRPLILNGTPEPFTLTVTLTFNLADS